MAILLRAFCAATSLATAAGFTSMMPLKTPIALRAVATSPVERAAPTMATIEPRAKCLVLGSGWIQLLTAKTAALRGRLPQT